MKRVGLAVSIVAGTLCVASGMATTAAAQVAQPSASPDAPAPRSAPDARSITDEERAEAIRYIISRLTTGLPKRPGQPASAQRPSIVTTSAGVLQLDNRRKVRMNMFFAPGQSALSANGRVMVSLLARALNDPSLRQTALMIGGHTDAAGAADANMKLSIARADAVRDALIGSYGIDPARLIAHGFGETRPLVPAEPNSSRNRMVEIVLVASRPAVAPPPTADLAPLPALPRVAARPFPIGPRDCLQVGNRYRAFIDPRPLNTGLDDYGGLRTPAPCPQR
ncbi:MAG: OmpA family protein [Pseudomonadota bacterium]